MKKVLAILLIAVIAMTAVFAQGGAEASGVKTYKVGVGIYTFDDNFMTLYRNEILSYFASLETDTVKYQVTMADGKNDMGEQSNQVDNFITQGMDVIILNLVQTRSSQQESHSYSSTESLLHTMQTATQSMKLMRESSPILRSATLVQMHASPVPSREESLLSFQTMETSMVTERFPTSW